MKPTMQYSVNGQTMDVNSDENEQFMQAAAQRGYTPEAIHTYRINGESMQVPESQVNDFMAASKQRGYEPQKVQRLTMDDGRTIDINESAIENIAYNGANGFRISRKDMERAGIPSEFVRSAEDRAKFGSELAKMFHPEYFNNPVQEEAEKPKINLGVWDTLRAQKEAELGKKIDDGELFARIMPGIGTVLNAAEKGKESNEQRLYFGNYRDSLEASKLALAVGIPKEIVSQINAKASAGQTPRRAFGGLDSDQYDMEVLGNEYRQLMNEALKERILTRQQAGEQLSQNELNWLQNAAVGAVGAGAAIAEMANPVTAAATLGASAMNRAATMANGPLEIDEQGNVQKEAVRDQYGNVVTREDGSVVRKEGTDKDKALIKGFAGATAERVIWSGATSKAFKALPGGEKVAKVFERGGVLKKNAGELAGMVAKTRLTELADDVVGLNVADGEKGESFGEWLAKTANPVETVKTALELLPVHGMMKGFGKLKNYASKDAREHMANVKKARAEIDEAIGEGKAKNLTDEEVLKLHKLVSSEDLTQEKIDAFVSNVGKDADASAELYGAAADFAKRQRGRGWKMSDEASASLASDIVQQVGTERAREVFDAAAKRFTHQLDEGNGKLNINDPEHRYQAIEEAVTEVFGEQKSLDEQKEERRMRTPTRVGEAEIAADQQRRAEEREMGNRIEQQAEQMRQAKAEKEAKEQAEYDEKMAEYEEARAKRAEEKKKFGKAKTPLPEKPVEPTAEKPVEAPAPKKYSREYFEAMTHQELTSLSRDEKKAMSDRQFKLYDEIKTRKVEEAIKSGRESVEVGKEYEANWNGRKVRFKKDADGKFHTFKDGEWKAAQLNGEYLNEPLAKGLFTEITPKSSTITSRAEASMPRKEPAPAPTEAVSKTETTTPADAVKSAQKLLGTKFYQDEAALKREMTKLPPQATKAREAYEVALAEARKRAEAEKSANAEEPKTEIKTPVSEPPKTPEPPKPTKKSPVTKTSKKTKVYDPNTGIISENQLPSAEELAKAHLEMKKEERAAKKTFEGEKKQLLADIDKAISDYGESGEGSEAWKKVLDAEQKMKKAYEKYNGNDAYYAAYKRTRDEFNLARQTFRNATRKDGAPDTVEIKVGSTTYTVENDLYSLRQFRKNVEKRYGKEASKRYYEIIEADRLESLRSSPEVLAYAKRNGMNTVDGKVSPGAVRGFLKGQVQKAVNATKRLFKDAQVEVKDREYDEELDGTGSLEARRRAPREDLIESNIRQNLKHPGVYDPKNAIRIVCSAEQNELALYRDNGDLTFDIIKRAKLTKAGIRSVDEAAKLYKSDENADAIDKDLQEAWRLVRHSDMAVGSGAKDGKGLGSNVPVDELHGGDGRGDVDSSSGANILLRSDGGRVVGTFNPATKKVTLYRGADEKTVYHELIGHGVEDWARRNNTTLHGKLLDLARTAPESLKAEIREKYPDADEATVAKEIIARFAENKGAEKIQLKDAPKNWVAKTYVRVRDAILDFAESLGFNRVNLNNLESMTPAEVIDRVMGEIAKGKTLGEIGSPDGGKMSAGEKWANEFYDRHTSLGKISQKAMDAKTMQPGLEYDFQVRKFNVKKDEYAKLLKEGDVAHEEVAEYMKAKGAEERLARGVDVGIDKATIDATLKHYENHPRKGAIERAADFLWKMQDEGLKHRLENELISKEQYDEWTSREKFHVPFRSAIDEVGGEYFRSHRGMEGKEFERAEGRYTESGDPVAFIFEEYADAHLRAIENNARKVLADEIGANAELGRISTNPELREMKVKGDGGEANVVKYKAVGKNGNIVTKAIILNGERGAAAASSYTNRDLKQVWEPARKFMRFWSATATEWSPTFALRNAIKDNSDVALTVLAEKGTKEGVKWIGKYAKNQKAVRSELWDFVRDGTVRKGSTLEKYFKEGGMIGGFERQGYENIRKTFSPEELQKTLGKQDVKTWAGSVPRLIKSINSYTELATRLSAFKTNLEGGMSEAEAAKWSRQITVDFNRKGNATPVMNTLFMFSNSVIGSKVRQLKAINNAAKTSEGRRALALILGLGVARAWLEDQMNQDDEENAKKGKAIGKDVSEYTRKNSLFYFRNGDRIFNLASHDDPLSQLAYLGDATYRLVNGKMSGKEYVRQIAGDAIANSASLFGVGSPSVDIFETDGWGNLQGFTPTALQPVVQLMTNTNFMGSPIYQKKYTEAQPDSYNGRASTSEGYKAFVQLLNDATGGNAGRSGAIDITPETAKHWVDSVGKNVGKDAYNFCNLVYKAMTGTYTSKDTNETPIVRDVTRKYEGNDNRYFQAKEAFDKDKNELDKMKSSWTSEERKAFREAHPHVKTNGAKNTYIERIVNGYRSSTGAHINGINDYRKLENGMVKNGSGRWIPRKTPPTEEQVKAWREKRMILQAKVIEKMGL